MFWQYILDVDAIFIPVFYLEFVLVLVGEYDKKKILRIVLWSLGLLLSVLSFTSLFKMGVSPIMYFNYWIVSGPLYFVFPLFYSFVVISSMAILLKSYWVTVGVKREQIKYMMLAGVIGFSSAFTYFLPQLFNIYPVGNFFVVLYVVIVAYAITKHRLMDIRMVLRSSSVAIASFVSIIVPAIFIKGAIDNMFVQSEWLDYVVLIAVIIFFPSLKNYYSKVANKYFFSSLYDSRQVIKNLSDRLSTTLRVRRINKYIFETISSSMHASSLMLLLYNEKTQKYKIEHSQGEQAITAINLIGEKRLHLSFVKQNKPIIVEELRNSSYVEYRRTIDFLIGHGVEIIVPLNLKKKTIGIIALGPKESKDIYNKEDLQVLEIIGVQSAIAIQNALQYEEVKKFGIKLEKEVEKATAELRAANEELKKLDEAKSEFVSIASHQLRTPLTVIKGYISMILEGDFGKLSDKQIGPINKVYASNERLIDLVEDLLNISRIESGRLRFTYKVMDIEPLISSVFEELQTSAKEKGLEFVYKKPAKRLPDVNMDEEKIRQVIMNITDNSIKYTKQGKVEIELKQNGEFIEYTVKDNGMGIKKEDLPNLFKKFSRGTGTSLIHTEGTGLGLYVAKQMAEAHQGRVWAESDGPDKGSLFTFQIPVFKGRF
jgi:signal transduction histidine kinase